MDADVCDSDLRELVLTLLNPSEYIFPFYIRTVSGQSCINLTTDCVLYIITASNRPVLDIILPFERRLEIVILLYFYTFSDPERSDD